VQADGPSAEVAAAYRQSGMTGSTIDFTHRLHADG
jgi:hypothetical protein